MEFIAKLVIFLPLLAGIINGVFVNKLTNNYAVDKQDTDAFAADKRNRNKRAGYIASGSMILVSICATILFVHVGIKQNLLHIVIVQWLQINDFSANWAIYVDQLTAIMFIVITYVSAVVHIYSLGYMKDDGNLPKFLSYLSLFTFFMLALVSSDNFLQLFFGWEGVGLCSYLLIGYYFHKDSANEAAVKAFIVNRVGDFALVIGIVLILLNTGSVEFKVVFTSYELLSSMSVELLGYEFILLDVICLLLFIGCMGKSAQIGLHVWLPDAMEGPTPVSALIHAATMVTAGVFLLARCSFLFEYSPNVLQIITVVGAVTCLFAATIAIVQEDIKKIIAYSTCSQLGYMFFACGVSAYQAGIFHLVTHGFFKALLFLGAGSVIHACGQQDVFKMGGLRTKMPITYANFWIGSLAIIGIFPFAGFYSKDLVLESAYAHDGVGKLAFMLGIVAAILTAIYSLKIIILTFHGKTRLSSEDFNNVYESPKIMNIPLMLLTMGTMFSGMFGYYILNISNPYGYFAGSIFNRVDSVQGGVHAGIHGVVTESSIHDSSLLIKSLPLIVGIFGMLVGYYFYKDKKYKKLAGQMGYIYSLLKNKYYFDELYNIIFIIPLRRFSNLVGQFDINIIDKFGPNGFSITTRMFSWCMCQIQTGYIFNYAFYIIFALVACITFFVFQYYSLVWS